MGENMKRTLFIKNAAILTVSSFILRFAGIIFKVWLAAKIGAEGVGLYQLVFSVYMFAATFATSGICTAVTRIVSQELIVGNKSNIKRVLKRCIQLSLIIAFITIFVLFFGANFISEKLLHEARSALSLKILSFSLPFMSICSCVKGYFIARRKTLPPTTSQLLEQVIRIAVIVPLVLKYNIFGLEYACAAVLLGDVAAEAASCIYILLHFCFDFKRLKLNSDNKTVTHRLLPIISHIALPITSGKYLNSLLHMIENVLVPICLSKCALTQNGMSLFGMIKGMALPILFFPSTLLTALSTLLLPEISEAAISGKNGVVKSITSRIIKITSLISIIISAVFYICGKNFGILLYNSTDVGFLLRSLSPIVPFMYVDAISDGILKGLDQQKFTFFTSVGDSLIRIAFILLFLKQFGIYGFIGIMYFSNFLTGFLNTRRLIKVSKIKLDFTKTVFIPVCCAFFACLSANFMLSLLNVSNLFFIICIVTLCLPTYFLLLFAFKIINYDDISFIRQK